MVRAILGVLSIVLLAGAAYDASQPPQPRADTRRVLYYIDPMHPAYRSDRPGSAPDCGMNLEPVFADTGSSSAPAVTQAPDRVDAPLLQLSSAQQASALIHTETVEAAATAREWHTVGRVVADEARVYQVSAGVDGWVRRLFADRTGTSVSAGQPLAEFYSKDLSAPQQAFVYATESHDRLVNAEAPARDQLALASQQLATARDNLRFFGMGDAQINELGRHRREFENITLTAPAAGRLLERHVSVGQRFMKGELLYRLADLTRVWVEAELRPGEGWNDSVAEASIAIDGEAPLNARVAAAAVPFEGPSRVGRLRLEVENPAGRLTPGMLVNVELRGSTHPSLTVPASAIVAPGRPAHVFVARDDGQYELREVETGAHTNHRDHSGHSGDRVAIVRGLVPGERVVTAGAFLLDSESRIRTPQSAGTARQRE